MIAGPWRFGLGLLMGYPLASDRRTWHFFEFGLL